MAAGGKDVFGGGGGGGVTLWGSALWSVGCDGFDLGVRFEVAMEDFSRRTTCTRTRTRTRI